MNEQNNIPQVFNFNDNPVTVLMIDGNPWWVAKDVCNVLGICNTGDAVSRLDDDERNTIGITDGIGNPLKNIINESGLWSLVLTSRKPEAKAFKKWLTSEVIPSLRKTGSYSIAPPAPPKELTRLEILQMAVETEKVNQELTKQIEDLSPKARLYEKLCVHEGLTTIGALAKDLVLRDLDGNLIGEMGLYEWLRGWCHALCYGERGLYNLPYQNHLRAERFRVVMDQFGRSVTMVTRKGVAWVEKRWAEYLAEEKKKRKHEIELRSLDFCDIDAILNSIQPDSPDV